MIYGRNSEEYVLVCDQALLESGFFDEIDRWKRANQDSDKKTYKNNMLTDDEYNKVKEMIDIMTSTEDYSTYKKAFDRFCYFCHIVSRGVVLYKYTLKKGKEDKNSLEVVYAYNTKRLKLPDDTKLYHMSKVPDIKELKPTFRGKSARGFLYDKPRIYFTVRKNLPKRFADYKPGEKMHMYEAKENIKNVFVDPLLWGYSSGAVYIETNKDVKVEEINGKDATKNESFITESSIDDSAISGFFNFIQESGLIIEGFEE